MNFVLQGMRRDTWCDSRSTLTRDLLNEGVLMVSFATLLLFFNLGSTHADLKNQDFPYAGQIPVGSKVSENVEMLLSDLPNYTVVVFKKHYRLGKTGESGYLFFDGAPSMEEQSSDYCALYVGGRLDLGEYASNGGVAHVDPQWLVEIKPGDQMILGSFNTNGWANIYTHHSAAGYRSEGAVDDEGNPTQTRMVKPPGVVSQQFICVGEEHRFTAPSPLSVEFLLEKLGGEEAVSIHYPPSKSDLLRAKKDLENKWWLHLFDPKDKTSHWSKSFFP